MISQKAVRQDRRLRTYIKQMSPLALAIVLSQCSSSSVPEPEFEVRPLPSDVIADVPAGASSQINRLLLLAADAESPQAEQYTLQASQLALDEGDTDTASAILGGLGYSNSWPLMIRIDVGLQRTRLALAQGEAARALILLNGSPFERPDELPASARLQMMQLRADAFQMMGQPLAAAREYTRMAPLLNAEQQAANNDRIWQLLSAASLNSLQAQRALVDSYELRGWMELVNVVVGSQNNIEEQVRAVESWQARWNQHSASKQLPQSLSYAIELLNTRPERIALLLPLSDAAGRAVSEGFIAAYYDAQQQNQQVPQISVYDTSNLTDILSLYNEVASSGVDLIIGPLRKDSVRQLQAQTSLPVPTLALNYGDDGVPSPANLYQFGLAPEDEIRQAVQLAWQEGHRVAAVLTPAGEEYRRITETFENEWTALGGHLVASTGFTGTSSYSDAIRRLLDIDDSEARTARLNSIIPRRNLISTPRRRQDVDVMFLLANPSEGRLIKPAMGFHFSGDVDVYAMPAIYDGSEAANNRDLNGVVFIDAPWLLTGDPVKDSVQSSFQPGPGPVERLRAMGVDSYRLHTRLAQLDNFPGISIQGATGILTMREDGSIKRELIPARFDENAIMLLPPPGTTDN